MKKINKYLLVLIPIGLIAFSGLVYAFGGELINQDQRLAIKQAIESNNYTAWKEAIIGTLTEERFNKTVERYNAMTQRKQLQDAVKQAIQKGDYEAYKEAIGNLSSHMVMSEENFNAMVNRFNTTNMTEPGRGFGRFHMLWHMR
jgi:hypothetical protein